MQQDMQEKFFEAISNLTGKSVTIYMKESESRWSPIPEKERGEIIYECPEFLGMKYTPPPLNETATPVVRKNDAALCGIQMALTNMTRPIDYYVNRKLKGPTTGIQDSKDLILPQQSITQSRVNNLHRSMRLPGRVPQLLQSINKPPVENKQLEALLAAISCQHRAEKMGETAFGTSFATAHTPQNTIPNTANNAHTTQLYKSKNFQTKEKNKSSQQSHKFLLQ
ncbi:hypothetical protein BB561_004990 [Smittium simulii]|uniref:Uncharacterized protein n=1 Tax=Smittium simulii TaxID=133385 RepID=A0A2T9YCY5_9FUNG|nr:hypothetical protein BB561_004990 [Smittium simulii]